MKKATALLASAILGLAAHLHAQIITSTSAFSFTSGQAAINIGGSSLYTGPYIGTDGGIYNDWVLNAGGEEGPNGIELEYATSAAQWLTGGPVAFGASIDSSGTYSGNFNTSSSTFTDLYYGLDYTLSPGNVEYGWAELSYNSSSGQATIVAAALNTTVNTPSIAGSVAAVPEPSTYALLAFASSSLLILRRKKNA